MKKVPPDPLQKLLAHFKALNFKACALYPNISSRMRFGTTTQNALPKMFSCRKAANFIRAQHGFHRSFAIDFTRRRRISLQCLALLHPARADEKLVFILHFAFCIYQHFRVDQFSRGGVNFIYRIFTMEFYLEILQRRSAYVIILLWFM